MGTSSEPRGRERVTSTAETAGAADIALARFVMGNLERVDPARTGGSPP
jgi:hypothetical protein